MTGTVVVISWERGPSHSVVTYKNGDFSHRVAEEVYDGDKPTDYGVFRLAELVDDRWLLVYPYLGITGYSQSRAVQVQWGLDRLEHLTAWGIEAQLDVVE